jgi:hypothetical protein
MPHDQHHGQSEAPGQRGHAPARSAEPAARPRPRPPRRLRGRPARIMRGNRCVRGRFPHPLSRAAICGAIGWREAVRIDPARAALDAGRSEEPLDIIVHRPPAARGARGHRFHAGGAPGPRAANRAAGRRPRASCRPRYRCRHDKHAPQPVTDRRRGSCCDTVSSAGLDVDHRAAARPGAAAAASTHARTSPRSSQATVHRGGAARSCARPPPRACPISARRPPLG